MTKFTFSAVAKDFDEHIRKSIRGYDDLWNDVVSISKYFVENKTNVIDIGCSTGSLINEMYEKNRYAKPDCVYTGIEIEPAFYNDLDRLKKPGINFFKGNVVDYDFENCSFVSSIFTLQFLNNKDKRHVLEKIYQGLNNGSAFVYSEKVFNDNPRIQDMLTFMHYDFKRKNFTEKEILEKEQELRHMMKPCTDSDLNQMLIEIGFEPIRFWQNHNFVGAVAIKI